ncbi:MAG: hypothetical protein IJ783_01240 [Kiritimatiellae bacterium]|nr:hypothetical protein [Kiritimatiellia bacterium]
MSDSSFPYPVLGFSDSVSGPKPTVTVVPHIPPKELVAVPYRWEFSIGLGNPEIEALVASGKASFFCEIKCSSTFLRECASTRERTFELTLERHQVNGRVEFSLWVVADEALADYRNAAAHEDYRDLEPFEIEKGAPLAFLKSYHWDADLCYEDLTSLRSILKIEKHPDPEAEFPAVDTEGDYVCLFLPGAQYGEFLAVANNKAVNPVLHSSLLLHALQSALVRYPSCREKRWARALARILESDPNRFGAFDPEDPKCAADLALRLLDNPVRKLGESIAEIAKAALASQATADDREDD